MEIIPVEEVKEVLHLALVAEPLSNAKPANHYGKKTS
jgi:hypothetical protein